MSNVVRLNTPLQLFSYECGSELEGLIAFKRVAEEYPSYTVKRIRHSFKRVTPVQGTIQVLARIERKQEVEHGRR